ncbi:ThiF family adenylyltransferase [Halopseudomonas xiamenensis]|uniref:ThiF family adenylyltransferase n=1 Tax=Halopseudomonas xiamenensis TaxID=157792 RepID=UPI0016260826|nr:ThiF family adenylyltransferase [Halopseudomonas xiamenensis]
MIWWADLPARAQAERNAVADLTDRNTWLLNVVWRLAANLQLAADFDFEIGERTIPLTLVYPDFFPDATPSILPRDGVRLSGHQYGTAGELCLEHRPDNWTPDVTGAMMIESAHRLLSSEQETGEAAPSDHRTLPAQRSRGAILRFLYSCEVWTGISMVEVGQAAEAEIQEHNFAGFYAAQLSHIGPADAPIWTEQRKRGHGAYKLRAVIAHLPEGTLKKCKTFDELKLLLETHGFGALATELSVASDGVGVILFDGIDLQVPMVLRKDGSPLLINYETVFSELDGVRLDPEYDRLAAAKIAVVGCGSVGSKVAVHLARSGVGSFVLIDGDLLKSGNLVRNELDWRAVGIHKAPALATRLKEVSADCIVTTRTTVMGGQESGGTLSATMRDIEECDLIIDATADATVFNLCAAIARRAEKPMCWAQVFGGGAGGIVVRLRPKIDPTPLTARQRIEGWYADQGVEWPDDGSSQPYAETNGAGTPLIADDADVSVVAAHLSRFAIDILARPEATIFPYSAYLIGLTETWLFTAPFDVRPIDLGERDAWGVDPEAGDANALKQLLADLLPGKSDAG